MNSFLNTKGWGIETIDIMVVISNESADEKVSGPILACASWVIGYMSWVMSHELLVMRQCEQFFLREYINLYCPCWLDGEFGNYIIQSQTLALLRILQ